MPDLSAIVLCYRAEESIRLVVGPLLDDLRGAGIDHEVILVANYTEGVPDRTPEIVRELAHGQDDVRVIAEPKQGGMGWDLRSGFEAATGDVMVAIDGDAQNPVEDVLRMYQEMRRHGADVMKGRRIARFDGTYRHVISQGYNLLFRAIFRTRGLWDINGKPKGLTRRAYEALELKSDDWFIDAEIVLGARRAGLTVSEMPVIFRENEERSSFVRFSAIGEFLKNMARARLRK